MKSKLHVKDCLDSVHVTYFNRHDSSSPSTSFNIELGPPERNHNDFTTCCFPLCLVYCSQSVGLCTHTCTPHSEVKLCSLDVCIAPGGLSVTTATARGKVYNMTQFGLRLTVWNSACALRKATMDKTMFTCLLQHFRAAGCGKYNLLRLFWRILLLGMTFFGTLSTVSLKNIFKRS